MSDILDTAVPWLVARLKASAASIVTYRRGGFSVVLLATFGRSEAEQIDNEGFGIRMHARDFIITAADLILNGIAITPVRGDLIEENGRTHEVLGIGSGPCFEESQDQGRAMMRIHTKQLRIE